MTTPPATIRARLAHTARRIARLERVTAALTVLQRVRRKQLANTPVAPPVVHPPVPSGPTAMFDSVTLSEIPKDAQAVAGYVGGRFPTFSHLAALFPKAHRLSIAVASTQDAECLDVEPGDAPPSLAPGWVKRQHARGVRRPVVYTSVSGAQALVDLMTSNGLARSTYRLWTAHYTFREHLCGPACGFNMRTVADATQWTDKALGRNLDQSHLIQGFFS